MKPRFALDLTNEAVSLLERADGGGWIRIAHAVLSDPMLAARLSDMRALAERLAPEGFFTKLILPNSQILYLETDVFGYDQAERRAEIRKVLEGRTPYEVDELTFDFSRSGTRARVAVVAKVTLEEAETFARDYGFRPAAFVARPEAGDFSGEPYFGATTSASEALPPGERFDRDQDPVRVIAFDEAIYASSQPVETTPAPPQPAPLTDPAIESDEAPFIEVPEDALLDAPDTTAEAEPILTGEQDLQGAHDTEAVVAPPSFSGQPEDARAANPFFAHDVATTQPRPVPLSETSIPDPSAPKPTAPAAGFQSRRAPDAGRAEPTQTGARLAEMMPRLSGLAPARKDPAAGAPHLPRPSWSERLNLVYQQALGWAMGLIRAARPHAAKAAQAAQHRGAQLRTTAIAALTSLSQQTARLRPAERRERVDLPRDPTVFGALPIAPAPNRISRPLLVGGAIALSFALVAALVLVVFFFGGTSAPPSPSDETQAQAAPEGSSQEPLAASPAPKAALPASASPSPQTGAGTTGPEGVDTLSEAAAPAPESSGASTIAAEATRPPSSLAAALPEPELFASDTPFATQPLPPAFGSLLRRDASGMIIATPDGVLTPEGFLLIAGKPPRVPPLRPTSLLPQQPTATPLTPATPGSLIEPATLALPALSDPSAAGAVSVQPVTPDTPKPRQRPAELLVPPPPPLDQGGLPAEGGSATATADLPPLAPPVDPRHSARKPQTRPAAIVAAAQARLAQDEAVADAAAAAARAEAEAAAANPSPYAVATSRRPAPRSAAAVAAAAQSRLAESVAPQTDPIDTSALEAALAEAQSEVPGETSAPDSDASASEQIDEPEPLEGIATMPTTRTVAKKSTLANAIDLGDINLIGVYGSNSARRALVRMPSGRFVKVKVGDRLDGGQVAAIGENQLSYVKKGKTYVLKMVKGG